MLRMPTVRARATAQLNLDAAPITQIVPNRLLPCLLMRGIMMPAQRAARVRLDILILMTITRVV